MGYFNNICCFCTLIVLLLSCISTVYGGAIFYTRSSDSSSTLNTIQLQQLPDSHGPNDKLRILWRRNSATKDLGLFFVTLIPVSGPQSQGGDIFGFSDPEIVLDTGTRKHTEEYYELQPVVSVSMELGPNEGIISLPTWYSGMFYLIAYNFKGEFLARSEVLRINRRSQHIRRDRDSDSPSGMSASPSINAPESSTHASLMSDTPIIAASVLGTVLACLMAGTLFYFLRRQLRAKKAKTLDPEYPFTNHPHQHSSGSLRLTERNRSRSPVASVSKTLASVSQSRDLSLPATTTNTFVEETPSERAGSSRDPWEGKNFYATPKANRSRRRVDGRSGSKRKRGRLSMALSGVSKSTKSTTSSGVSRGTRGTRSTVTGASSSVTEVSSIRFCPNTERQMEIEDRIQELQGKLALFQRTVSNGSGMGRDAKTGSVTLANMTHDFRIWKWKKQIEKLNGYKDSDWALGKTDVVPSGLYKFDGTSTSNL